MSRRNVLSLDDQGPVRSGLPSGPRGAGAKRLGLPSAVRGTSGGRNLDPVLRQHRRGRDERRQGDDEGARGFHGVEHTPATAVYLPALTCPPSYRERSHRRIGRDFRSVRRSRESVWRL